MNDLRVCFARVDTRKPSSANRLSASASAG